MARGESVVGRLSRTLLGSEASPDHEQLVSLARERYEDDTPFAGTLAQHVVGHQDDLRAREAFLILCMARPSLAQQQGFEPADEGRRLAADLVAVGQGQRADRVLEFLHRRYPDDAELEAERISSARRTGTVDELIARLQERSAELDSEGRRKEAVRLLRQALLLAPARRDIATRIRALNRSSGWGRSRWLRPALAGLLVAGLAGTVFWRERALSRLYAQLPEARPGERTSLELRLTKLDELMATHPLWHGTFAARRHRLELTLELEALSWSETLERTRLADEQFASSLVAAETARLRARTAVLNEKLPYAIAQYELALRIAPPDWEQAPQVRADLAAVRAHLAAQPAGPGRE